MNPEDQRMFAHRFLLDADAFTDLNVGAKDCKLCASATLSKAREVAKYIVAEEHFVDGVPQRPSIKDVWWNTDKDVVGDFSQAIRMAHSRHAGS